MVSKVAIGIIAILVIAAIAAAVILSTGNGTSGSSSGKTAVMATDPASSGSNTREYEHYYNEEAHRSCSPSGLGWVMLNATGTLQPNTLVNASQTVVIANVQAGTYDSFRFLFDSATVTYNGQNYTAKMSYSQITANLATSLFAQLSSSGAGASVTSSSSATLTYGGTIRFGSPPLATTVTAGQSYLVTVIGSNSIGSTAVTAA